MIHFKEILSLIERNISWKHTMMGGEPICAAEKVGHYIQIFSN